MSLGPSRITLWPAAIGTIRASVGVLKKFVWVKDSCVFSEVWCRGEDGRYKLEGLPFEAWVDSWQVEDEGLRAAVKAAWLQGVEFSVDHDERCADALCRVRVEEPAS